VQRFVARSFEKIVIAFLKFKKMEKILNIGNNVFYKHTKFELQITYIVGSAKIKKVEF
jgi:hypothetical protein